MNLFDSHCHLTELDFDRAIKEAKENGIDCFLCVGWNLESSKKAVELAEKFPEVYAAVGVHPENYEEENEASLTQIEELAKNPKVIAVGEIGLDYHWKNDPETKKNQKEWFIRQIELSNKLGLPVSIHGRDASEDLYEILKTHQIANGFVLHCYSGSVEMMKKFASLGAYFGFDGPITYKNAKTPKECVLACPADRLLIETDCPYLPPVPFRGQTNEPKHIKEIFEEMAKIRGEDPENLSVQLNKNFERLFKIKRL